MHLLCLGVRLHLPNDLLAERLSLPTLRPQLHQPGVFRRSAVRESHRRLPLSVHLLRCTAETLLVCS